MFLRARRASPDKPPRHSQAVGKATCDLTRMLGMLVQRHSSTWALTRGVHPENCSSSGRGCGDIRLRARGRTGLFGLVWDWVLEEEGGKKKGGGGGLYFRIEACPTYVLGSLVLLIVILQRARMGNGSSAPSPLSTPPKRDEGRQGREVWSWI